MIRQNLPIQFGSGLTCYRWLVSTTDFNLAAANTTIQTLNLVGVQPGSPYNQTVNFQYPQGSLVLYYRAKTLVTFAGTSLSHVYLDVGYPQTIQNSGGVLQGSQVAAAAPHAINGGSGGSGSNMDLFVTPADNLFTSAAAGSFAPGDAAFGVTVSITLAGANWTALTAGEFALDLIAMTPSMGELWQSQYYGNPSPGNP